MLERWHWLECVLGLQLCLALSSDRQYFRFYFLLSEAQKETLHLERQSLRKQCTLMGWGWRSDTSGAEPRPHSSSVGKAKADCAYTYHSAGTVSLLRCFLTLVRNYGKAYFDLVSCLHSLCPIIIIWLKKVIIWGARGIAQREVTSTSCSWWPRFSSQLLQDEWFTAFCNSGSTDI